MKKVTMMFMLLGAMALTIASCGGGESTTEGAADSTKTEAAH